MSFFSIRVESEWDCKARIPKRAESLVFILYTVLLIPVFEKLDWEDEDNNAIGKKLILKNGCRVLVSLLLLYQSSNV